MRELEAKKMPRRERFSDSALSSGSPDFQTRTPKSAPEVVALERNGSPRKRRGQLFHENLRVPRGGWRCFHWRGISFIG